MDLWKEQSVICVPDRITVIRYDGHKDLVWIGTSEGKVASFYGPMLRPYTSFLAHPDSVKDIQISNKYVVTLGSDGVRSYGRNGVFVASNPQAIGDVLLLLDTHEFLVGYNRRVKRFTLDSQIKENGFFELDSIPKNLHLTHMSLCTPNIAIGLSDGTVQIVEPHAFDPVLLKPIVCHSGPITDLDSRKNVVATCGLSQRRYGMVPDVFVSCYDAHSRRPLPPFSVSSGASFVRLHPKAPTHAIIAGSNGQLTILDSKNPSSLSIKQVVLETPVIGFDISPLGDAFALADNNSIHFWSNHIQHSQIDTFKGLDVPNAMGQLPIIADETPLSAVGMPYYNQELLSNWGSQHIFEIGFPAPDWNSVEDSLVAQSYASTNARRNKNKRSSSVSVPRFLSEQARLKSGQSYDPTVFVDLMRTDDSAARGKVPKLWRQMLIHYSKFGVDDFDFSFYNSTKYAGLEPLTTSRHCNAILQLYRWCPAIYNQVLESFAINNWRELNVTGELAVVLDMLAKAEGYHCRATNFIDTLQIDLSVTGFHDELCYQLREEYKQIDAEAKFPLDNKMKTIPLMDGLDNYDISDATSELDYIFVDASDDSKYKLDDIPPTLCVVSDENGKRLSTTEESTETFKLVGYTAEVDNEGECHAVAVVEIENTWHLFNDFLVTPISRAEALEAKQSWKRPNLLLFSRTSASSFDFSWCDKIDTRLLKERHLASGNWDDPGSADALLKPGEPIPKLVALDAEFVLIRKELSEVHSDGSKNLVSPKKLSLARLSVLREDETVLFDDMVESRQPVVDYVTAYSGIEPGDLDPLTSKYGLVARKNATRKLWILLNSGTTFVGHALINDFRTINLYVPQTQVIDTFDLFYDQNRNGMRRFSLKFLMWAVLGERVQTGNHDSVQDAQSALRLYRRYQKLKEQDMIDETLTDIIAIGQKYNYRVPTYTPSTGSANNTLDNVKGSPAPTLPARYW